MSFRGFLAAALLLWTFVTPVPASAQETVADEKISEDGLYSNEAEQFTIDEIKELI